LRLEAIRDAALAGAGVGLVRTFLAEAQTAATIDDAERAAVYCRQALNELEALRRTLRDHFDRLGAPPSTVLNGP
jgi:DNA-binding transcriptional LysR family regulator